MQKSRTFGTRYFSWILTGYFFIITLVYPLFFTRGYLQIGQDKYEFFRVSSFAMLLIMTLLFVVWFILSSKKAIFESWQVRISITDLFVYGYMLVVLLSLLTTDYTTEAFWGTNGWWMGAVTQIILAALYFLYSRVRTNPVVLLGMLFAGAGVVFLLGIANRYGIYPFSMEGQVPAFLSTLGNINWYSGYWAVICPVGVGLYWACEKIWVKIVLGVFCIIAFLTGITQGSGSGALAMLALLYIIFFMSFHENKKMFGFLQVLLLLGVSGFIGGLFEKCLGLVHTYDSPMNSILTNLWVDGVIILLSIAMMICLFVAQKKRQFAIEKCIAVRWIITAAGVLLLLLWFLLALLNTRIVGGLPGISENTIFILNANWGNGRGATWQTAVRAYASTDILQKFLGVGPDCFASFCYDNPEIANQLYAWFGNERLTNAHNEWLTMLVNLGALGLVSYAGIFISAFIRFLKGAKEKPILYAIALSVLLYTVHGMVSFQQVLNVPFVMMLMGMGERSLRGRIL